MYKADRQDLQQRYGLRIAAPEGALAGQLTPDFATLQADWAWVMQTRPPGADPGARRSSQ